jgi:NAD(P)H-flavin reductase
MPTVVFEEDSVQLLEGESLLEALLRRGHDVPNGCRSGVCQSCVLSTDDSDAVTSAQSGLSAAQKQLGYFLSCQFSSYSSIAVKRIDTQSNRVSGEIVVKELLNEQVIKLGIKVDLNYKPGQYVTLWKDQALARSYSVASKPNNNGVIDLHIRKYPDGKFSSWVDSTLAVGHSIDVQGPLGQCIYTPCLDQPMLLAAIGTGLAPIWGILQDALSQGHQAPIALVVGAKEQASFYLLDQLRDVAKQHVNISLHLVCQEDIPTESQSLDIELGDIYQYCAKNFSSMKGYRVFLCGAQTFVTKMRKQCFMAGANMKDISADVFIPFGG